MLCLFIKDIKAVEWDSSCETWENEYECLTWSEKVLNPTTKLCERCPNGQYFDTPVQEWQDWGTSWYDEWAYQTFCFECASGKYYNLDTLKWVDSCGTSQFLIENEQFYNYKFWRSNEYYINPESDEIVELGTKKYPFKNIGLVFVELLNLRSHSDVEITINITSVTIQTYSIYSTSPGSATLFVRQYEIDMFNEETTFNILINNTLSLSTILNSSSITDAQRTLLSSTDTTLFLFSSNLSLTNLRLQGDLDNDSQASSFFIRPIYLQEKSLRMKNVHIQLTGMILRSQDPMSLYLQDLYLDFHSMMGGFNMNIQWNYPEAYLDGILWSSNLTVENPVDRIAPFRIPFLVTSGPEDINFTDSTILVWGSLSEDRAVIETYVNSDCLPTDNRDHYFTFTGTKMSMSDNESEDKFTSYYVDLSSDGTRRLLLSYVAGVYTDQYLMPYPTHQINANALTEISIINATFSNVTWINGGTMTSRAKSVLIKNTIYENWDNFDFSTFQLLKSDFISMINLTHQNVNGTGTSSQYYLYLQLNEGGTANLDSVNFYNWDLKLKAGIYFDGLVQELEFKNSVFSSLKVGTSNSVILVEEVGRVTMQNWTFEGISHSKEEDEDMKMVNFQTFNLDQGGNSSIDGIKISNSRIAFLEFNSVKTDSRLRSLLRREMAVSFQMTITDIVFQNWEIDSQLSLISFGNLESTEDVTFSFSELEFSYITFGISGELLKFGHQLENSIAVSNSKFSSISGGEILIESANLQNSDLKTKVDFINSTFLNIDANYLSLMQINEGAVVSIDGCNFTGIYTLEEGAVIFAGYRKAVVVIKNSSFTNNYAVTGGVFNIESESVIQIYNSTISSNFAVTSGVAHANNNGYFEVYDSKITQNYAISSSVSQIFDVADLSVVNNSKIYSNVGFTQAEFVAEISVRCSLLCFLSTKYKNYLIANSDLYDINESNYAFQLISGSLSIQNNTEIYLQNYIFDTFQSTLIIENSKIYSVSVSESSLKITSTVLEVKSSLFYNISEVNMVPFIFVAFESKLNVEAVEYYDSNCTLFICSFSSAEIDNLKVHNITTKSATPLLYFDKELNITLTNSEIYEVSSPNQDYLWSIVDSYAWSIKNVSFHDSGQYSLYIDESVIQEINSLTIQDWDHGVYIDESTVTLLTNSNFERLGGTDFKHGGAIIIDNSNVTISNSSFSSNSAIEGGAIYYICSTSSYCSAAISNSTFTSNIAAESGGAVYYTLYRPEFSDNNYVNNTALYGPNIASYAVKIKIKSSNSDKMYFTNVGSGILYDQEFTLALYDHDGQLMVLDSASPITITGSDTGSIALETTSLKVKSGEATFSDIIFKHKPGSTGIRFNVASSAVDIEMLKKEYGDSYELEHLSIDFRWCKPGEIIYDDTQCNTWSPGTYSIEWNSTKCENCLDNTSCLGGDEISVNSGYWRYTSNSTIIVECPNEDACKGGYNPSGKYPVYWATGYEGELWSSCITGGSKRYEKVSDFEWAKCPEPILNAIKVAGFFLLVWLFLIGLITLNIRKKEVSQKSVLMRQLTNHIQVLTLILANSFGFPKVMTVIFSPFSRMSSSSETIVSFDCFANESVLKLFAPSVSILKVFLAGLTPLFLFIFSFILFAFLKWCFKKWFQDYKRNVIISWITILYFLHPVITQNAFKIFQWIDIDSDVSRTRIDLNITWYSKEHLFWWGILGLPMMIIWVFGLPIIALFLLIRKRAVLHEPEVKRYYIVLYQGYKDNVFYWEFVNITRKILMLSISVFLARESSFYKGVSTLLVTVVFFRFQVNLLPYIIKWNNELEQISITSSGLTIFGGILFSSDDGSVAAVDLIVFIMIILANLKFILFFVYLMSYEFSGQFQSLRSVVKVLAVILFRRDNTEELVSPSLNTSKLTPSHKIKKLPKFPKSSQIKHKELRRKKQKSKEQKSKEKKSRRQLRRNRQNKEKFDEEAKNRDRDSYGN